MKGWRDLLAGLFDDADFSRPAEPDDLRAIEVAFNVGLPEDLKALLAER